MEADGDGDEAESDDDDPDSDGGDPDYRLTDVTPESSDEDPTERSSHVASSVISEPVGYPYPGLASAGTSFGSSSNGQTMDSTDVETEDELLNNTQRGDSVASTRNGVRRVWDRQNICLYCETPQSTLARHLERRHANEHAVQEALSLQKNSRERAQAFMSIRNRGNCAHNVQVRLGKRDSELIPWRRKQRNSKNRSHDFLMCSTCSGFFFRKTLWRHKRTCSRRRGGSSSGRVQRRAMALLPPEPGVPEGYQQLLDGMVLDDVSLICKTDPLIKSFGVKLFRKHGNEKHQRQYISCRLRELGRLVKELKRGGQVAQLATYLTPAKFTAVTEAVRVVAKFNNNTNKFGTPSLALKIGHSLKTCIAIEKSKFIQNGTDQKPLDDFLELMELEWCDEISRRACATLYEGK